MKTRVRISLVSLALLSGTALADATSYSPRATGFTLPNAQLAVRATTAQNADYATAAGSAGFATAAGTATSATFATSAGSAKTATDATNAVNATTADTAGSATYAGSAGIAQQAAGLTAGNNCPAGTALSVTRGVLGCVSSVTSITGQLNGSQIVGNITNVGAIQTSGSIVAGGNLVSTGYVNGQNGLYSGNGVYANDYFGRGGGSGATFNGTALSAQSAKTAGSAASLTGQLDGSQIVGNITNVGSITTSGNIVSSNGYVYGVTGLFTDNAVFSNTYAGRWGGGNAVFNGTATAAGSAGYANSAGTANSASYATTAGSTNYAASTNVGILHQSGGSGDGSSFYCDAGYTLRFYDLNVNSTNNAFFYECIQNGH
jgi:hypothetical protein